MQKCCIDTFLKKNTKPFKLMNGFAIFCMQQSLSKRETIKYNAYYARIPFLT